MSINNIHWEDIAQFVENNPGVLRDAPGLRKRLYENGPISAADLLAWQSAPRQSAAGLLPVCEHHVDLLDRDVTQMHKEVMRLREELRDAGFSRIALQNKHAEELLKAKGQATITLDELREVLRAERSCWDCDD